MAQEVFSARERQISPFSERNVVSQRTRSFDSDVTRAIARRGQSLLRQYTGYNGNYQTAEEMTESQVRNSRRINRAVNNMILGR